GSVGTNDAVYVWSPGATLLSVRLAAPLATVLVPTTVSPSRTCTLPAADPMVTVTVVSRVTFRPLTVASSVVVDGIVPTVATLVVKVVEVVPRTVAARVGDVDPLWTVPVGTNLAV